MRYSRAACIINIPLKKLKLQYSTYTNFYNTLYNNGIQQEIPQKVVATSFGTYNMTKTRTRKHHRSMFILDKFNCKLTSEKSYF